MQHICCHTLSFCLLFLVYSWFVRAAALEALGFCAATLHPQKLLSQNMHKAMQGQGP